MLPIIEKQLRERQPRDTVFVLAEIVAVSIFEMIQERRAPPVTWRTQLEWENRIITPEKIEPTSTRMSPCELPEARLEHFSPRFE